MDYERKGFVIICLLNPFQIRNVTIGKGKDMKMMKTCLLSQLVYLSIETFQNNIEKNPSNIREFQNEEETIVRQAHIIRKQTSGLPFLHDEEIMPVEIIYSCTNLLPVEFILILYFTSPFRFLFWNHISFILSLASRN